MKARKIASLCLVISLLLSFGPASLAQETPTSVEPNAIPPQALRSQPSRPPIPTDPLPSTLPDHPVLRLDAAAPAGASVATGPAALTYRYDKTLGVVEVPYPEDTAHLNGPRGLGLDGAGNVWIAEGEGRRLMSYSADGQFLQQIGRGGWPDANGATLWFPHDVAVDVGGNIWFADTSHQVTKFSPTGEKLLVLGEVWNQGDANDRLNDPASIAFDAAGHVFVSDTGNHRVQVFTGAGDYLATVGMTGVCGTGNSKLCGPLGVAVAGSRLYVADSGNHRIQVYNIGNLNAITLAGTIGISGQSGNDNAHLNAPTAVAVDPARDRLIVADGGNWRLQVFSVTALSYTQSLTGFSWLADVAAGADGLVYLAEPWLDQTIVEQRNPDFSLRRVFGVEGVPYLSDAGHFYEPSGVAALADAGLAVGESNGRRLLALNADGSLRWQVGEPGVWGGDSEHFSYVRDVAVDAQQRVYAVDEANCRVQLYTNAGAFAGSLGGTCGADNGQFERPWGLGIGPDGKIYVADTQNHRVQIFDANRNYVATIGQTGVATDSNSGFRGPRDVAVDSRGFIYVSDTDNGRVQVFNPDRTYIRTMGKTYGHDSFNGPHSLLIGPDDRLYVSDSWNNRVQVFDRDGAYITTVGGNWGIRTGDFRSAHGTALDKDGNLYVADWDNARIQKFAPGVPGWKQVNVSGFGDRSATWMSSLLPFKGSLYAAGYPARVWRMSPGGAWTRANEDGFGDTTNSEIDALAEFNNNLYAATYTWACDDENCNSGHTNGPQIWRTSNGSNWQNVTPSAGIGSGDRYVTGFVVFGGYLYAGLGHGNTGKGAEIWRTADGLAWTRVLQNGLHDVYDSDVLSFAVYNGQLYAGTRHGDWHDDSHPDGPLGGEVWRSANGTTWTSVNAPGFGDPVAHRVENLQVFQNALYAYVSHVGGSSKGADVWRCTKATCESQADWTKVVDNGFGVPANQYLYAGAVAGSYLYAAVANGTTGVQLWRTGDGQKWEKATPYDGLGNSNNSYVSNNAMAVFDGRLTLGMTNWASGVGVWQQTVTADFTATPRRGPAPLTVQFTNTSAGDYTSSEWDFGDGEKSTETNPTHTYTKIGTYSVTLKVGDGVDTNSTTKPAYVDTRFTLYLPMVMKLTDVYDDFNDPAWDGSWNPAKWGFGGADWTNIHQQSGVLVVQNSTPSEVGGGEIQAARDVPRSPSRTWALDVRVKMSSDRNGGWTSIQPKVHRPVNGHGWTALCSLGGAQGLQFALFDCGILVGQGNDWTHEYHTAQTPVAYDTWHAARIEIAPGTAEVRFYLDGQLVGRHTPNDADALKAATDVQPAIALWNGAANATATRFADDVRITPVR